MRFQFLTRNSDKIKYILAEDLRCIKRRVLAKFQISYNKINYNSIINKYINFNKKKNVQIFDYSKQKHHKAIFEKIHRQQNFESKLQSRT